MSLGISDESLISSGISFFIFTLQNQGRGTFLFKYFDGTDYELFINNKEPLENGYIYKFRTRYESNSRKTLNDWQIANCLKSTIDGELVPAIARY